MYKRPCKYEQSYQQYDFKYPYYIIHCPSINVAALFLNTNLHYNDTS